MTWACPSWLTVLKVFEITLEQCVWGRSDVQAARDIFHCSLPTQLLYNHLQQEECHKTLSWARWTFPINADKTQSRTHQHPQIIKSLWAHNSRQTGPRDRSDVTANLSSKCQLQLMPRSKYKQGICTTNGLIPSCAWSYVITSHFLAAFMVRANLKQVSDDWCQALPCSKVEEVL